MFKSRVVVAVFCVVFLCSSLFTCVAKADLTSSLSNPAPTELWSYIASNTTANTIRMSWSAPIVAGDAVLILNHEMYTIPNEPNLGYGPIQHWVGTLYAINAATGTKLWNFTDHSSIQSRTIVDGVAYFGANNSLYAWDAISGVQKWSYNVGAGVLCIPVVLEGVVYVGIRDQSFNCYVCALKISNGEELWKYNVAMGNYVSSLAVVDGSVYFSGPDNNVYTLKATDGAKQWKYNAGNLTSSPLVVDGTVFCGSYTDFYALSAMDGTKLWSYHAGISQETPPIVIDGVIYVNALEKNVYAFDTSNGNKLWNYSYPTRGTYMSPLFISDDLLYFSSRDTLYALNAGNGTQLWSQNVGRVVSFVVVNGAVYYNSDFGAAQPAVRSRPLWLLTALPILAQTIHSMPWVFLQIEPRFLSSHGLMQGQPQH
jgi:outer membrane protein assembly factor BamB